MAAWGEIRLSRGWQMNKNRATFLLSGELLSECLALPEGTTIIGIQLDNMYSYQFRILVEHEDLPAVKELERATEISPMYTADIEKKPSTWLTFDWGLPNGNS